MAKNATKTTDESNPIFQIGYLQGRLDLAKNTLGFIVDAQMQGEEVKQLSQTLVDDMAASLEGITLERMAEASSGVSGASGWASGDVAALILLLAVVVGGCFGLYNWVF